MNTYNNILLASKKYKLQRDYWIKNLLDMEPQRMFHCFKNNNRKSGTMKDERQVHRHFPPNTRDKLVKLSKNSNETLYVVILAAFISFLYKYTRQQDIVIGIPVYKSSPNDMLFNRLVILRMKMSSGLTFKEVLIKVREKFLEACENQEYPFEKILEELNFLTEKSYDSLFDLVVASEALHTPEEITNNTARLLMSVAGHGNDMGFTFQYDRQFFDKQEIEQMSEYFCRLVEQVMDNLFIRQIEIELMTTGEVRQLLVDFNCTQRQYPWDRGIHHLFETRAELTPHHSALVFEHQHVSYRELNQRANRLAQLLKTYCFVSDSILGIMADHSLDMVEGVLGILKAGAAYLPLDPGNPRARINYILKDSNISVLLTQSHLNEKLEFQGECIFLDKRERKSGTGDEGTDANPEPAWKPTDLAYVIYTSGSTGRPKGTLIPHRGLVNYIWAAKRLYITGTKDVFALFSPLVFDFTITSIFTPLVCGLPILIYHDDGSEFILYKILRDNIATILKLTPAHLSILKEIDNRSSNVKTLVVGGEDLKANLAAAVYNSFGGNITIYNEYGPTETVVGCMVHQYDFSADQDISIPIGTPIDNMRIYNLDKNLEVLPQRVIGEIFIAGDGLARGYLNNPDLTGRRFLKNPFQTNEYEYRLMYESGDLARFLDEKKLVYVGRADHQVIIRGFRIELGEIEKQLLKVKGIKEAVVIDRKDKKDTYLCAYIVSDREFAPDELRHYLEKELPDYMVPGYFMKIDKIPLSPGGKLDKASLPEPKLNVAAVYTAPKDDPEKKLVKIWAQILELEESSIGIYDDFFQLGGHSLRVTQLSIMLQKEFNRRLPMSVLFSKPTIAQLKEQLADSSHQWIPDTDKDIVMLKKGNKNDLNFFFIHGGDGNAQVYINLVESLGPGFNYWGINAPALKGYAPGKVTIEDIASSYVKKIKSLQPVGPYWLAGWSAGGVIAFEMAAQLEQLNETVEFLGLIDSYLVHDPDQPMDNREFSRESEKNLIQTLFNSQTLADEIGQTTDINQLWEQVVHYLQRSQSIREDLLKLIPQDYKSLIPGNLDIGDMAKQINLLRTHEYAQGNYRPGTGITARVYYFQASETALNNRCWEDFTRNNIKFYTINGNHDSVLKSPAVHELAKTFKELVNKEES